MSKAIPTRFNPWLTLPDGWNTVWLAAKGSAGSSPAWISVLGDSLAIGQNCGAPQSGNWPSRLISSLLTTSGLPQYADYFPAYGMSTIGWASGVGYAWSGILNAYTPVTNNNRTNNSGWHRTYEVQAGTSGYHQTFTLPAACTSIDIISVDNLGGTWVYNVGAGDQTVTTTTTQKVRRTSVAGPFPQGTVVSIGKQQNAGSLTLMGIVCYYAAAGLGMARLAGQSQQLIDMYEPGGSTQYPANRVTLFSGRSDQAAGVLGANAGLSFTYGFPLQPHLAILCLGINDCFTAGTFSQYQATLQRLILALRAGRKNCSIIMLVPCYPNGEDTDAGVINPPTVTPTILTASGTLTAGSTYNYALGYGSIYGDTTIGPATGGQTGSTGYQVNWSGISTGVDHLSIYRQTNAGGYKLINQISAPPASGNWTDAGSADGAAANTTNLSPITNWANWRQFIEEMNEVARQYNCAVANIHGKWGGTPNAQGFMGPSPNIHPVDTGYADMASLIASVL